MSKIDILLTALGLNLVAMVLLGRAMLRILRGLLTDIIYNTRETAIEAKRIADAVELGLADPIRCEQARRKQLGKRIAAAIVPAFKEAMKYWKFRFK